MDEVSDRYRPDELEPAIASYWESVDAYEAAKEAHKDDPPFYFLDGPPYTNGSAHMGHAWNKSLKDCYIRYHRMTGHDVIDRPGYDMHGLPIETRVEEQLGFENKKDIEEYGMENFIADCRDYAEKYLEVLQSAFIDFGVWMDWEDPYRTLDPEYMEAAWWGFKQAHERGLVEQGKRSISQCPRCETAIANNEVEYDQIEDPSIYVKFPLADRDGSLVIWTTTPWTIPGNTFVAVAEELTYQGVEATRDGESEVLWIAEDCVEDVLKTGRYDEYEILENVTGAEMVGWEYDHPLADSVPDHVSGADVLQVYTAEYVEADRTGLVHSAPGHGEEDFRRGQELDLPIFCPVGQDGIYTGEAGRYAGSFVREANDDVRADLDEQGLLLADERYTHDYGHCWRCDTGIIQIVTDQWFVTVTDIKDELLDNIGDSEWYPSWARDNRFYEFVENSPDWNVSRQRYWGTPLPIWVPEDAPADALDTDMIVIGSREELAKQADQDIDEAELDLHRPTVDDITITENGTTYRRIPDVFDVWLDSAVAPWGSLNYPGEEAAFEELFPADLVIEAHDQTRGWFWSMLGMGTTALGEIPYKNVLMYGHALMPDGRAMSKSKGLIVDPYDALDRHGADVMRLALLSYNPQGEDMRFSWDGMDELARKLNILWNVFRFPLPYMELDAVEPQSLSLDAVAEDLELIDRWVLSRLQSTVRDVRADMEMYRQDRAIERIISFVVDDVSRFYVQAVRERMWLEEDAPEKTAAYATLTTVLRTVTKLLAPITPHLAEKIYQTLTNDAEHVTVHAADWPAVDESYLDETLEADVTIVREIEESAATARQEVGRKLRWPIQRLVVETDDNSIQAAVDRRRALLQERMNAQAIEIVEPEWAALEAVARPVMSAIGPTFGADAEAVMEAVNGRPIEDVREGITIDGEIVELDDEMLEIERKPPESIAGADFAGGTVYVDATLTDEIEAEGYAREVVRRIQQLRKELDLEIDAGINTTLTIHDDRTEELVSDWLAYIETETRTDAFVDDASAIADSWDVEGVQIEIGIEPIHETFESE